MTTTLTLLTALQIVAPPASAPAPQVDVPPAGRDVIVTARRREESAQRVPIAISVIAGETLERTGTYNVARLTQSQPAVQLYTTNPRNTAANIRGLGVPFGLTNDGIEQGVGIYIDQVYNGRIAAATLDFLDVERVEVLRGPQGTLYGKNTTAGAINITTRAPSFVPEARLEYSFGNYAFLQAKGSVSGPLAGDRLAVRLAASRTYRRGTIFNVTSGDWVNGQDNIGVRGQLLWRAGDAVELNLTADYNRQDPECCAQIYVRTGSTQRPLNRQFAALAAAFGYAPPSTNAFDRLTDLDTPLRARQALGGVSLRAAVDLGAGTLSSVTAWRFWDWDPSNDRDFIGLPITTVSANPSTQRQWTQEFRYSATGERFDYTLGLFGFHQTIATSGRQVQGTAASRWLLNPASAAAGDPAILDGLTSANDIDFVNTSVAAFGQLVWKLTDRFKIQPGLRLNYDRKTGSYIATVTTGSGGTVLSPDQRGVLAPQNYTAAFNDWNLSGDLTLSYRIAPDVFGYATYAKSFKSGGINLSGLPLDANSIPILAATTVRPEKVDHFEVGLKSQAFGRRVTFNLAGFWTEIGDYQATVTNGQLGVIRGYLANAERVRVRGIEADLSARPTQRINLYINGAYTDARYLRFRDAPCPPELSGGNAASAVNPASPAGTPAGFSPVSCDISGQVLPGVSKWAVSYGAEYALPVRLLGKTGEAYLAGDGNYRSAFSSNPSRSRYTDIDGYSVNNFRIGYRTDDHWNYFLWLRNAFGAEYYDVLALQSGNTGLVVGQPGDPRTYGITVSKRW